MTKCIPQFDVAGQHRLNALLPLVNTLDTVDREDPQVVDPLLEQLVELGH